jgi:hypothetical protein
MVLLVKIGLVERWRMVGKGGQFLISIFFLTLKILKKRVDKGTTLFSILF